MKTKHTTTTTAPVFTHTLSIPYDPEQVRQNGTKSRLYNVALNPSTYAKIQGNEKILQFFSKKGLTVTNHHAKVSTSTAKGTNDMAPNKRADNLKMVGVYVDAKAAEKFKEACEFFGFNMAIMIRAYIEQTIQDYDKIRRKGKAGNPDGSDAKD